MPLFVSRIFLSVYATDGERSEAPVVVGAWLQVTALSNDV